jgi:hypothetical protein
MRKLLLLLLAALSAGILTAQDNKGYQLPPKDIADLLLAPPTPAVSTDRKGEWMLLSRRSSYPSVEELAQPELRIAGLRFNPDNYALSRQNFINGFSLKNLRTGKEYPIQGLPQPLFAGNITWSPAESKIAFTNTTNKEVDLYVLDIATKTAAKINKTPLNTILGLYSNTNGPGLLTSVCEWISDNTLLYKTALQPASAAPPKQLVPK